jgi:3-deoxy-D-manno-octulosonic-acid transferase
MIHIVYNFIVIPMLYLSFHAAGLFNDKIRRGIRGRKNLLTRISKDLKDITNKKVWFHISSYGEYEQAKPVMVQLKAARPDVVIIVSFFSPSAYEHIKVSPPVDYICYLPMDSKSNAKQFVSIVDPVLAVVVRHDIWPNFIWELNRQHVPVVLIDASIPPKSSRLWPIFRGFNRNLYSSFNYILTISKLQSETINNLLAEISLKYNLIKFSELILLSALFSIFCFSNFSSHTSFSSSSFLNSVIIFLFDIIITLQNKFC